MLVTGMAHSGVEIQLELETMVILPLEILVERQFEKVISGLILRIKHLTLRFHQGTLVLNQMIILLPMKLQTNLKSLSKDENWS